MMSTDLSLCEPAAGLHRRRPPLPYKKKDRLLYGARGLLIAVLAQAVADLYAGDPSAAAYFLSGLYRAHLAWLDRPGDWLPDGVTAADLAAVVEAADFSGQGTESAAGAPSTLA